MNKEAASDGLRKFVVVTLRCMTYVFILFCSERNNCPFA
jgi:hypothetical protein